MKRLLSLIIFLLPLFSHAQYISGCGPYTTSGPITLSSNSTVSGKLIDLGNTSSVGITGNGVTNVHITKCKIINNTNFAILLNGCTNITIDSCYISNVGFGVYAQSGSSQIKVNGNYFLNINGISTAFLGHAVQFNGVNGGGSQINNNRVENIVGTAIHPHDMLNVYQSNGLPGDSIQVIGNWIRGGQYYFWPDANSGAAGIIMGDVGGSYQVCRNNILVNTGYSGIQCNGTGTHIKIDHNQMFSTYAPVSHQAITILDANQIECSYNQTNWTNYNNLNVLYSDGETQYYLGNPASPTPVGFSTNTWKANITANILPASLIPVCGTTATRPNIAYSPTIYIFTVGVSASIGAPTNSGGNGVFSVSPALPAGLTLSPTGAISGVPSVATAQGVYTVSCVNSGGSSSVPLQITVNNPVVNKPVISYSPNSVVATVNTTIPTLTPANTGSAVVTWSISPALPSGLVFNNGVISGISTVTTFNISYTISATNAGGTGTATVTIQINPVKPSISYAGSPFTFTVGSTIVPVLPTNSGGPISSFSVSPALPSSLTLSTSTGQISGVPLASQTATSYNIMAQNAGGSSTAPISITIIPPAVSPPNISYSPSSQIGTINVPINSMSPINIGGAATGFSISPSLPVSLNFNTSNGVVSGTGTVTSGSTSYTIIGSNSGGSSTTHITLQINPIPAPSITYPANLYSLTQGTNISITPTNIGGAGTYSVTSGTLPPGLTLSGSTGLITGSATTLQNPANVIITCTNTTGSSPFTISFAVNAAPTNHWYIYNNIWFGPVFN